MLDFAPTQLPPVQRRFNFKPPCCPPVAPLLPQDRMPLTQNPTDTLQQKVTTIQAQGLLLR